MIQVVRRALDILEYVATRPERACSLTEIAESVKLHQATCANIIKTLVDKQYLEHVGRKKGYRLGAMAYHLTGNLTYNQNLILAAKDVMEELTGRLNETSLLGILRNQKRFIVHLVNSDQDLQVRSKTEQNLYETASGRLLLAYLPDKEKDNVISATGLPQPPVWPEASNRETLLHALAEIRAKELAVSLSAKHIVGLAVPIYKAGQVIAGLSVFLPESRFTDRHRTEILESLKAASQKINERLEKEV
jgi:DNA-binding IclR family transcriptional regulator